MVGVLLVQSLLAAAATSVESRGPERHGSLATLPGVRIGAHVKAGKGLLAALRHGEEIGAEVIQIHTQSPRMWRTSQHSANDVRAYREAQTHHPAVTSTFCHATYLINLATPDPELARKSRATLAANLSTARSIGADGLVLHLGSHRGAGFEAALPDVAGALVEALEAVEGADPLDGLGPIDPLDLPERPCPVLLENTAGAGDTIGRSFEELAQVISAADGDHRLGVCLDTQHLWASGISFVTMEESEALVEHVAGTVGLDRLRCLHLNDSKVDFGANRDRHENIGDGTIGTAGFAALLGHPALQGLPAILEVPGDGSGPRAEDVETARRIWRAGLALWRPNPTP
jgi:deoxyribonuclease IV